MENLYTVEKVFSDRVFCVPDYQRGYAWEEQQCLDFIEDLELLAPGKDHFLGLLILCAHPGDLSKAVDQAGHTYTVYDIIDGQQRLTTIVLFLNALRQEMERFENLKALAAGLRDTYVVMRDLNGLPRPKLTLNRDTHAFFYDTILEQNEAIQGPTIRSHQLLVEAKACFAAYLDRKRQALKDGYPEWLKHVYLNVPQKLTLVVYTAPSEADAEVVFGTMNNRGKELTELEKVKSYLLDLASKLDLPAEHDLAKDINDTWTHIFESLMGAGLSSADNEEQLLRAHWLMAYDYDPKKWDGSRSVKARFDLRKYQDRHQVLLEDLKAYLCSLRNATTAYCDIYSPTRSNAFGNFQADRTLRAPIIAAAEKLARLDVPATLLPLLMAARLRYPQDGTAYLEVLEMSEKFVFRVYRWLGRPAYTARTWMFRLGHDLYYEGDISGILNELRIAILRYCPDTQFEGRFQQAGVDWFQWSGLTYFLYEYEYHLAQRAGQPVRMPWETATRKKDTIEHVLPQALDEGGYWAERFTSEAHRQYVHDIGNLTLTYDNSALGKKPFPEKKGAVNQQKCYASSKLFVEQQLAGYDEWTAAEIMGRRQELANWAMERWHIEPIESPHVEKNAIEQIRLIIARGFVPRGQLVLFKILYEAGEQGMSLWELADRMRVSRGQIRGILGALGGRVNYTKGLRTQKPGIGILLEWKRSAGDWCYYMRPELKAAIEALPRLHDAITGWSVAEIDKTYKEVWDNDSAAQRNDLDLPARG